MLMPINMRTFIVDYTTCLCVTFIGCYASALLFFLKQQGTHGVPSLNGISVLADL